MALPAFHIYRFCIDQGNGVTHVTGQFTMMHNYLATPTNTTGVPPNFGVTGMGNNKWDIAHNGDLTYNGLFGNNQGPYPGEFFKTETMTAAYLPTGLVTWETVYSSIPPHPGCGPNQSPANPCYERCRQYLGKYECGDTMINGDVLVCYPLAGPAPSVNQITNPIEIVSGTWGAAGNSHNYNKHIPTCDECHGIAPPPLYECQSTLGGGCTCVQTPAGTHTLQQCNNLIATNDPACCPPVVSATTCYCCYNNNTVGVMQSIPPGQSCSVLNGTNGYSSCDSDWTVVQSQCELIYKPKHCYCCDGAFGIGVNQAANPMPVGADCSYYNDPLGNGWYNCDHNYNNLNCDSYVSDCTCCDNGSALSMGPSPVGTNCNWFNSLGYTNCDITANFNQALCEPDPNEHCACCKNGQMTMIGLPLPFGEICDYWSGMYGWNSCTGATFFNIDTCEDCHCDELIGTGRTSAFSWDAEDDCLEGCCDPDLKRCDVLVVGDNEGVQVYSTTGDNTTHLFDVPSHDTADIAANQNFIWVYKVTGGGTQIDEYQLVMAPFTNIYIRTFTIGATDIGNGLSFYGVDSGQNLLTSVNDKTWLLPLPSAAGNQNVTPILANDFPGNQGAGYKCTGDILTKGGGGSPINNSLDVILYDNGTTYKVAKVQRLTGIPLEEHIISPALMTGTTKFHSLYADTPNNRLAGIMTDGRIYELKQSPILEFGTNLIGYIDFYNTGGTRTVYGATNVDYSDGTCASKYITYPKTYDCTVNGCVDPGNGMGQYTGPTASADCNTLCIITWNCNPGTGYPNCTNTVTSLPYTQSLGNFSWAAVQSGPTAILYVSTASSGLQYDDFNTMYFYWGIQPIIPGQCVKWSQSGGIGKWKISEISHPQITTTIPIQSWAAFIQTLATNGVAVNMSMNYTQVENICYSHFGAQYEIDVTYEPCICTPVPCDCTPLIGTTGTFSAETACMAICCPPPPCTVCCQANSSNFPLPPYTWMITSPTSPCNCPSNTTQVPCITCNKCCTNGTLQIMLSVNDQNCDCASLGLWSCYLPPCSKCCYNKFTGQVYPAPLPDCLCGPGHWMVPCHSLPHDIDIKCIADPVITTPTNTATTTTGTISVSPIEEPVGNVVTNVSTGTNVNITSATKIYAFYDTTSMGTTYANQIQNSVDDWLISNGLPTSGVTTVLIGDERWMKWVPDLYLGQLWNNLSNNVPPPALTDDVLVIAFIDESSPVYHTQQGSSPAPQNPTQPWKDDYTNFKIIYSQITGTFNAVLYPTVQGSAQNSDRRGHAMQTFQAISSGNKAPLDGTWTTGSAPRQTGTVGGVPALCSNANLSSLEINNSYWSGMMPVWGGLDQFGWDINIRFETVTTTILTSDLNNLL